MKNEDVIAALQVIADKGLAINIAKPDLQNLITYNLITVTKGTENDRSPVCALTKKGKVMLKAGLKKTEAK